MYPELNGKTAIISGAGGSLGRAVVRRLHREGVRLALIDRSAEALEAVKASLNAPAPMLATVDLTDAAAVATFVEEATSQLGGVHILVNIAGGFTFSGSVVEINLGDWDALFNVNVKTAAILSGATAKRMIAAGNGGRIVTISARAALSGSSGLSAYSASKAALLRLTESMAEELLAHRITVNAVLPSVIDTAPNRKAMPNADFSTWVTPESLADVIAFLVSDAARDISGAAIPVYGRA